MLKEGRKTAGVWGPLAAADIYAALVCLIRLRVKNPEEITVPGRGETLRAWCLPMMAGAIEADEKERQAIMMLESLQRMAEKK
jgi:hypothetical protein